jgi:uncharacterized protein (TIGR02453 family)
MTNPSLPSNTEKFSGFSPEALAFLRDLKANNSKVWFEAHRSACEQHLLAPLRALTAGLTPLMLAIDPDLVTAPTRVISRIHRDTRFTRDKSPYKTTLWLTFKRPLSDWQDAPAFFFELGPTFYRYGMGFYCASKQTMDRLRAEIESKPEWFLREVAFLGGQDAFVAEGDLYKIALRPDLPQELQEWHRRRNLYLVCNRQADETLFSRLIVDELRRGFALLAQFYGYLWQVGKGGGIG